MSKLKEVVDAIVSAEERIREISLEGERAARAEKERVEKEIARLKDSYEKERLDLRRRYISALEGKKREIYARVEELFRKGVDELEKALKEELLDKKLQEIVEKQ